MLSARCSTSRSAGFYAWKTRPASPREKADAKLAAGIAAVRAKSKKGYGSPRVHRALRKKGAPTSEKRVARRMRQKGLVGRQKRRFRRTTESNHTNPIAPNVLERNIEPAAPNHAWAGGVTYIAMGEGWSHLAVLLDLFSRRVVDWALRTANDTELALAALNAALRRRGRVPAGLVHHAERGNPYASDDYRKALATHGMIQSMSWTGDCWDHAVAESFFASLRADLVDHETYATAAAAERGHP